MALAEQNLIRADGARFSMLETIRELALEELDAAGEEQRIRGSSRELAPRRRRGGRPEPPRQRPRGVARAGGRGAREPVRRADLERVRGRRPRDRAADRGGPAAVLDRARPLRRGPALPRGAALALPRADPRARAGARRRGLDRRHRGRRREVRAGLPREPGAPAPGRGVVPRDLPQPARHDGPARRPARGGAAALRGGAGPSPPSATSGCRPRSRGRTSARWASSRAVIGRRSRATSGRSRSRTTAATAG